MRRILWTAYSTAPWLPIHGELAAQCKGSKAELKRRCEADDPAWVGPWVRFERAPMFNKAAFRRGYAVKFTQGMEKVTL